MKRHTGSFSTSAMRMVAVSRYVGPKSSLRGRVLE